MKLIYSKDINLLNAPENSILYPETGRTLREIVRMVETFNDDMTVITLSETVIKQIGKMMKEGKLNSELMQFESNLPEYKEYEFSCARFIETYVTYTKHIFK